MLALPGSYMSSVGAVVDGFALVARQVGGLFAPPYARPMTTQVRLLSPGGPQLMFSGGRQMTCDGDLNGGAPYRVVYLPAFVTGGEEALFTLLDHAQPVLDWLRWQRGQGAVLAASGSAVMMLAESGLMDGRKAAVLAPLRPVFRQRYPRVKIDARAALVEHEGIHTCSTPASEWPLVARLVEQTISPMSAQWLASATGMQSDRRSSPLSADDPLVAGAQFWLAQRFAQEVSMVDLAATLAVSHSTLIRRFEHSLGMTPSDYMRRLRVEAGKRLLQNTRHAVEQVAAMVGYTDVRSFRAVFRVQTGMSPTAYRQASMDVLGGPGRADRLT